jgi:hypothetical protein
MQETKYKAIVYIRLSSADDKQGKQAESDSVANQRKLISEWLKKHPEIEFVDEKVEMITMSLIQIYYRMQKARTPKTRMFPAFSVCSILHRVCSLTS